MPAVSGSESFRVAKASGNHPALTWTVASGSYRVVVMNTDASPPVAFAGGLDLTIPHLFAIGIGLLVGGRVLALIAIVLIVLGARARPRPQCDPLLTWPPSLSQTSPGLAGWSPLVPSLLFVVSLGLLEAYTEVKAVTAQL